MACPVDCITIETIKSTPDVDLGMTSVGTKKRLYVPRFDIDIAKCCYCALCVYPCPTECIKITDVYEFSEFERDALIYRYAAMTPEEIDRARAKLADNEKEQAAKKAAAQAAPKPAPAVAPAGELIGSIYKVHRGELPLPANIARKMIKEIVETPVVKPTAEPLTARELDVLRLLAEGLSMRRLPPGWRSWIAPSARIATISWRNCTLQTGSTLICMRCEMRSLPWMKKLSIPRETPA